MAINKQNSHEGYEVIETNMSQPAETHNTEDFDDARKVGAGIVAAIICLPFFGVFLASAAGIAVSYGTTKDGAFGDISRAAGDVALIARDKAQQVNQKHNLVEKTKEGASQIIVSARDAEQRHQILAQIRFVVVETLKNVGEACKCFGQEFRKNRERSQNGDYQNIPNGSYT